VSGAQPFVGQTPRLRFRRLRPGDLDAVAAMVADPEQMRYYPRPKTREEVEAWLAWNLRLYAEHGFGTWYLESTGDGAFAGYCGLRPLDLDGRDEVELAWHIRKTRWNQGLATEAAAFALQLGRDAFGLTRLVAIIHPDNAPSRRIADKLGMVAERSFLYDGEPTIVYVTTGQGCR
jgi:RimJ/RimL family protein N-acetyltransferase